MAKGVPQVLCFCQSEMAFLGGSPSVLHCRVYPEMMKVILSAFRLDDHVIQVSHGIKVMGPQDDVHQPLEHCGSLIESKGKDRYC